MSTTALRALLAKVKEAKGPLPEDVLGAVVMVLGDPGEDRMLVAEQKQFWPDRDVGAALRLVRKKLGYASVSYHANDTVDAWAGPHSGSGLNGYAYGTLEAPNVVLQAGLWALIIAEGKVKGRLAALPAEQETP